MRVGIVGLPQVGKSTIFNLLTHGNVDTSSWGGGKGEAHIGVAQVPDARLERLAEIFQPKKVTYATIEYVDLPGLAPGEGKAALEGQAQEMAAYLNNLRNVDALVHVVRAFENPNVPHPAGTVDVQRDIGVFELEMMFSDLAIVEKRLERLSKDLKKIKSSELELENSVLERFKMALEREQPLRELELVSDETKRIKGFTFLSAKPLLIVLNLGDSDAGKITGAVEHFALQKQAAMRNVGVTAVCGRIEAEIASLPREDASLFMADLGLAASGLARIIQDSYSLLGLFSFYTAGDPEVRAWTIPRNTTAQQAAGVIHTDFERGFIKAEVVSYSDMTELGSFQKAKNKGMLRLEGKDYLVQEGDVVLFRFNL
ncbi:MAG TPA: redox-regulated ATPase YchF [Acidobacteriota bacterium]|nr:redox-regulated ATPase YchF [Acidobacteriota bacterium]